MGYQESLVLVRSLAEAAGIARAFKEFENRTWIDYLVIDVPKQDMLMGGDWGFETDPEHCWILPAGTPCVVIAGQRRPYQLSSGRWKFIDGLQGIERGHYYDFFEALKQDAIYGSWSDDPVLAQAAYEAWGLYIQSDAAYNEHPGLREAIEYGAYGIEGDAEWVRSCRDLRATRWQRDLDAALIETSCEDELIVF